MLHILYETVQQLHTYTLYGVYVIAYVFSASDFVKLKRGELLPAHYPGMNLF